MAALNVIMLGAPGAGKGTQAERFAKRHGLPKISTGDMLREGIKQGVPLALTAKEKMDRGELVDDDTMVGIVRERLNRPDTTAGFVLDGFPRTVAQGQALDTIMAERANGCLVVVDIVVAQTELVRRLSSRRICSQCGTNADPVDRSAATCSKCGGALVYRSDDNDRVVLERLRVYAESTKPLVDYYRDRPTFRTVNGAQAPDMVAQELEATIADAARTGTGVPLGARG
jgi:adenylate kinase